MRLASGQLKQVEDLSSDDFLESARLISNTRTPTTQHHHHHHHQPQHYHPMHRQQVDENNNNLYSPMQLDPPPDNRDDDDDDDDRPIVVDGPSSPQPHESNLYVDSSVVRDFLEVGLPPPTSSCSPTSSNHSSSTSSQIDLSSWSPSAASNHCLSPPAGPLGCAPQIQAQTQTVLIKFFLESSRSIVFIEVPIEHPFFVFHRGWSSWNPQRTYDKFGLKCRKLKIGDTCISLIRRRAPNEQKQQDQSDQCNILFSSIKLNE